jgi:glutathione S-transferase
MRLYNSVGPNPQIVRTFAAEKGIALELVAVDLPGGENRQAPFLARNPMGQTPALETDSGQIITEVTAICEFLEELHPQPALIGSNAAERAETRMWIRRLDLGVMEPFMGGFRATAGRSFFASRMPLLSESAGAEVLELMRGNLAKFDGLLAGRTWVCGERFSLADILLGCFLLFVRKTGGKLPEGLTWVPEWLDRCSARESFSA